jgi:hypothetical protein
VPSKPGPESAHHETLHDMIDKKESGRGVQIASKARSAMQVRSMAGARPVIVPKASRQRLSSVQPAPAPSRGIQGGRVAGEPLRASERRQLTPAGSSCLQAG